MTDTGKLAAEAAAISASSPAIRKYAIDQAAASVALEKRIAALEGAPVTPPPPTSAWLVAPPHSPIKDITNATGIGELLIGKPGVHLTDRSSAGTFDSAVMLGPECDHVIFERYQLLQAASIGQGPIDPVTKKQVGRHGLYGKAPWITCLDWYVRGDPKAPGIGSAFRIGFPNFTARRFDVAYLWGMALFDDTDDHVGGFATLEYGRMVFAASAAILVDARLAWSPVTINGVDFFGPTDAIAHVDSNTPVPPFVVSRDTTINGQRATAANFENVPPQNITWT